MTPETTQTNRGGRTDPLDELRRRIDRARDLEQTAPPTDAPERAEEENPLEALRQRVESAADLEEPVREGGPLGRLYETIDRARRRLAAGALEAVGPEDPASSAAGDPLQHLRRLVRREIDELGGRKTPNLHRGDVRSDPGGTANNSPEARLGREVLRLLRDEPLPGTSRAEAAERLAAAIDDPDPDELREILRILISQ